MLKQNLKDTARAYSAIFFLDSPVAGAFLLAGTFVYPNIGAAGLIAALVGMLLARAFEFPRTQTTTYILNSLLVGLSLGAFYQLTLPLVGLVAAGAALAVLFSAALADVMWRQERLPVLVIPFLLAATVTALVVRHMGPLVPFYGVGDFGAGWLPHWASTFFSLLGATFFTVHPLAGAVVLLVILWHSRYLALLAVSGVLVGQLTLMLLEVNEQPLLTAWAGFNQVLVAIAIGGIYTVPGVLSFLTAMLAVVLTTLVLLATQGLLFIYGLPLLALPYIVVTLVFLIALRTRVSTGPPWLAIQPGMPEYNYEQARLARVRNGESDSVPLLLPLMGRWDIYQGFNGEHTHKSHWRHALDFYLTKDGRSFAGDGSKLEDFYCFGHPILSPAHGQVVRICEHLADNPPGDVDLENNWGNFVLIRLASGLHVLLAHLKQNSVKVSEGQWIEPGVAVGACGNSGRSPQPHVHLQVQLNARLGSDTRPFHLCSLVSHRNNKDSEYQVFGRPQQGDKVEPAVVDTRFANSLHFPVGRQLTYRVEGHGISPGSERQLQVEITLLGQFRLVSDSGASAAFEENNGVLACYDRQGPADRFLDIWLLACGLTPLSENARHWRDAPSARLFPLSGWQRTLLHIMHPLGYGLDSHYQRKWTNDNSGWQQIGRHRLKLAGKTLETQTECVMDPGQGCRTISCRFGSYSWRAQLTGLGLAGDHGVPGWRAVTEIDTRSTENPL